MSDVLEAFEAIAALRKLPATAKAAVTELAEQIGLETFPEVWALVRKDAAGKWELVAVSLDRALIPAPEPEAFLLKARLGKP